MALDWWALVLLCNMSSLLLFSVEFIFDISWMNNMIGDLRTNINCMAFSYVNLWNIYKKVTAVIDILTY